MRDDADRAAHAEDGDTTVPLGASVPGPVHPGRRGAVSQGESTLPPLRAYGGTDPAARPVPGASWDDLDPLEFDRLRRLVGAAGSRADSGLASMPDEEIAASLGVLRVEGGRTHLLAGALLLFGREEPLRWFLPNHEAAVQVLGPETDAPSASENVFFRWPLFRLAEELLARFRARNNQREIRYELVRVGVPSWAERAFRELLANALVHRDYDVPGAVHVQWTPEGIELTSPGGPVASPMPESRAPRVAAPAAAPVAAPPRPRSPLLADAFRRAGITERTGRGLRRVFAAQLRYGLAPPDFSGSTPDRVVAVLPNTPADLAFARLVLAHSHAGRPLALPDLQVLTTLVRSRPMTTAAVATLLGTDKDRARRQLVDMVGRRLVEVRHDAAGRAWQLSARVRQELRDCAAHVGAQHAAPSGDAAPSGRTSGRAGNQTVAPASPAGPPGWTPPDGGAARAPQHASAG